MILINPNIKTTEQMVAAARDQLNPEQQKAFDAVIHCGESIFLTGGGGVGKSHTISKIVEAAKAQNKTVLLTAPTGIAAEHIGGATVSSVFRWGAELCFTETGLLKCCARQLVCNADILIIDEISMCRMDMIDSIYISIEKANNKWKKLGKQPIQVISVGDFYQLPPVILDNDRKILRQYYGRDIRRGYAFQSDHWASFHFHPIILNTVMRQEDAEDQWLLEQIRKGNITQEVIDAINAKCCRTPFSWAHCLYPYNALVDAKNQEKLDELPGEPSDIPAIVDEELDDAVIEDAGCYDLSLKVGCQVMITANASISSGWYELLEGEGYADELSFRNGTMGTVVQINKLVGEYVESVDVEIPNGEQRRRIRLSRMEHDIYEYEFVGGVVEKESVGVWKQFPVKLSYAMSIHKSQGATYDWGNLNPANPFSPGQLYVALSRCRSLKNVHLEQPLRPEWISVDPDVAAFYKEIEKAENKED